MNFASPEQSFFLVLKHDTSIMHHILLIEKKYCVYFLLTIVATEVFIHIGSGNVWQHQAMF